MTALDPEVEVADRPDLPTWLLRVSIVIAAISLFTAWGGSALAPQLVDNNPRALIALNPSNPNLILVSNQMSDAWFFTIGFFRLIASDPFNYLIGLHFGEQAFTWLQRRSRTYGPYIGQMERYFRRFAVPIVFFAPNNVVCIIAGGIGMRPRTFALANAAGTVFRLILINRFGARFESPIGSVVDFIADNRVYFLVASFALIAWTVFGEFRGDNTELSALRELNKDLSSEDDSD
ncbi:MAG: DedA family protein [Acidimicrobiales bacterium]